MPSERSLSLTTQFEDVGSIIRVLSAVLTQLIDVNQKSNTRQHFITKFQSSYAPNITIQAYLERINKYAKCSPNCFIVALIYIDRLIEIRNIVLTSLNVHRILITSILLSTKVFDDEFYKNAYYAKLGGVSTTEMNTLEVEFLSLVNFNLYVSTATFEKYQQELQSFFAVSTASNVSSLSSSSPSPLTCANSSEVNIYQIKKNPLVNIPAESERIQDPDPNVISPLRPFDVNNLTGLRSVLFHPHIQLTTTSTTSTSTSTSSASSSMTAITINTNSNTSTSTTIPSQISTSSSSSSLFSNEESLPQGPPSHSSTTWSSSMFTAPIHDSPRSLASYPSTDPSPTLSSTTASNNHCPPQQSLFSTCQKQDISNRQEILHQENPVFATSMQMNKANNVGITSRDMECILAYPMVHHPHPLTVPSFPRSFPYNGTISQNIDPHNNNNNSSHFPCHSQISVSSQTQKYPSRQSQSQSQVQSQSQRSSQSIPSPAVVQTQIHSQSYTQHQYTRVHPPYQQSRFPQNCYDINSSTSNLQNYDASGCGYNINSNPSSQQASYQNTLPYQQQHQHHHNPNNCGYFPNQNTQLSFCPPTNKNYPNTNANGNGNQVQLQGVAYHPPQQMQYMGGLYYQPIPSHMVSVSDPRYLAASTTPNSVADLFGSSKIESTPFSRQLSSSSLHQPEEFNHRSNPQSGNRCTVAVGYNGSNQQYYIWNEHLDHNSHLGCSTGTGHPPPSSLIPQFHHNIPGMHYEVNSYPATTLFYPVPLPTVS